MSEPICYHYTVDCCGVPEDMFGHPDGYYPEDTIPLYAHPDPRVAELEAVLRECREAMNAVSNGVIKPPLMTEQAFQMMQWQDFLITAIAKIDEVLK